MGFQLISCRLMEFLFVPGDGTFPSLSPLSEIQQSGYVIKHFAQSITAFPLPNLFPTLFALHCGIMLLVTVCGYFVIYIIDQFLVFHCSRVPRVFSIALIFVSKNSAWKVTPVLNHWMGQVIERSCQLGASYVN